MMKKFRHRIVKEIAPILYKGFVKFEQKETRAFTNELIKQNKKDLIGIEIGVDRGENSLNLLQNLDIKELILIDPYINYNDRGKNVSTLKNKNNALKILKPYNDKISWFFDLSSKVLKNIDLRSIDFIYIDGNHNYEFVYSDIWLSYPLLKNGGLLGGHDFFGNYLGVVKAVINFESVSGLKLNTDFYDWWFIK